MIAIDLKNQTYVCPFCGNTQAYSSSYDSVSNVAHSSFSRLDSDKAKDNTYTVMSFQCQNKNCRRISITAINKSTNKQVDIEPTVVIKSYPDYIPEQILQDHLEANMIIDSSPKAAATLLRRCLQGMIHDFWGIHDRNLYEEIDKLVDRIPKAQWAALDGLRKMGNIGAHMEKDVNVIIDIDPGEAKMLSKLIELLLDKWYISRHDEEELYKNIVEASNVKEEMRK